jgi:hypothetical protein
MTTYTERYKIEQSGCNSNIYKIYYQAFGNKYRFTGIVKAEKVFKLKEYFLLYLGKLKYILFFAKEKIEFVADAEIIELKEQLNKIRYNRLIYPPYLKDINNSYYIFINTYYKYSYGVFKINLLDIKKITKII